MPVDDRLRAGLEANALDFLPQGEERLTQVRARLRRRRALQVSAATMAAAAVVAVGAALGTGDPSSQRQDPVEPPAPTTGPTLTESAGAAGIPDSTWTRVLTRAQAEDAGIPEADIVEQLGADDRMPLTFRFLGDSWSILVTNEQGIDEGGDSGTADYVAPGRVVLTSDSPGCPGCIQRLTWRIRGDRLVLDRAPGEQLPRLEEFILLGEWSRAD